MILKNNILYFLLLIAITILLTGSQQKEIFASSPFSLSEIKDKQSDWIDIQNGNYTNKGSNYTDIRAVNYFSNGITLNATVWLASPFVDKPRFNVGYGILIDADSNKQTGLKGFDYQVEISLDNETNTWVKGFQSYHSTDLNYRLKWLLGCLVNLSIL